MTRSQFIFTYSVRGKKINDVAQGTGQRLLWRLDLTVPSSSPIAWQQYDGHTWIIC